MRNLIGRLAYVVLLGCCSVFSLGIQHKSQLYVTVVHKHTNVEALDRMVTPDDVVVITGKPVADAKLTSIAIPASLPLYFVESEQDFSTKDAQVFFTHGNIKIMQSSNLRHQESDERIYVRKFWPLDVSENGTTKIMNISRSNSANAKNVLEDIDTGWLKSKLEEFSGAKSFLDDAGVSVTIRERRSANGKSLARLWLRQQFVKYGFEVSEHRYGRGTNMIAEKVGLDANSWIVLSAHMDSVGNAGADDDGSGVVTSLAVAASLRMNELRSSVRILSFDQEEDGLLGSRAYVANLSAAERAKIKAVINIEMTGYDNDQDGIIHAIHCNENTSKLISDELQSAINVERLRLKIGDACTNRSDHAAFWAVDIPAVVVSQNFFGPENDANPCYHRSCDRVDILNFDYMLAITKAITATTKKLLQ